MPRAADPAVRTALVERAAELLARREPVTLRGLVEATGTSTMAVYTHFGGMPGLWRAVRQEGFTRLNAALEAVPRTDDPVRDLAALGSAYCGVAVAVPHLYRAMFDAAAELEDPEAAGAGLAALAGCAERARSDGRFAAAPEDVAVRFWAAGHGLAMLVVTGVLGGDALDVHGPALATAVFLEAGDQPEPCRRSVTAGWELPR
ncbi:TetR/AcrR family transcriptional regulator [Geodermatophilus sp. SYSU D00691]